MLENIAWQIFILILLENNVSLVAFWRKLVFYFKSQYMNSKSGELISSGLFIFI